jgi:nitrogenase molybdenum-iron protein alpha/beta subunit
MYSPKLIFVITTCTADLIGDDIGAAVQKAKDKVDCHVAYSTGDFMGKSRPVGIQDSLYALADQMICRDDVEKNEGSVNLINSPTQRNALKFREMASLLTQMGIKINKTCFDHTTAEDMMDLARADLSHSASRSNLQAKGHRSLELQRSCYHGRGRFWAGAAIGGGS